MHMNNFHRLYEEEEAAFVREGNQEVLQNIQGTLHFFRILGDVADVYLSGMLGVLTASNPPVSDSQSAASNAPDQPPRGPSPDGPQMPPR